MNKGGDGAHWAGCEEAHHDCCLAKLAAAEATLATKLREMSQMVRIAEQGEIDAIQAANAVELQLVTRTEQRDEVQAKLAAAEEQVARAEWKLRRLRYEGVITDDDLTSLEAVFVEFHRLTAEPEGKA